MNFLIVFLFSESLVGENKYTLMSVTSGVGLIPQAEKFGREIAGDSYKNYIVIKKYDFAYNKSATKRFPEGYISMLREYDTAAVPNSIFTCFRITDSESYPLFFDRFLLSASISSSIEDKQSAIFCCSLKSGNARGILHKCFVSKLKAPCALAPTSIYFFSQCP